MARVLLVLLVLAHGRRHERLPGSGGLVAWVVKMKMFAIPNKQLKHG